MAGFQFEVYAQVIFNHQLLLTHQLQILSGIHKFKLGLLTDACSNISFANQNLICWFSLKQNLQEPYTPILVSAGFQLKLV